MRKYNIRHPFSQLPHDVK